MGYSWFYLNHFLAMSAIAWATVFDMNQYDLSLGKDVSTSALKELAIMLLALFKAVVF